MTLCVVTPESRSCCCGRIPAVLRLGLPLARAAEADGVEGSRGRRLQLEEGLLKAGRSDSGYSEIHPRWGSRHIARPRLTRRTTEPLTPIPLDDQRLRPQRHGSSTSSYHQVAEPLVENTAGGGGAAASAGSGDGMSWSGPCGPRGVTRAGGGLTAAEQARRTAERGWLLAGRQLGPGRRRPLDARVGAQAVYLGCVGLLPNQVIHLVSGRYKCSVVSSSGSGSCCRCWCRLWSSRRSLCWVVQVGPEGNADGGNATVPGPA
jgi:hypothetical protein